MIRPRLTQFSFPLRFLAGAALFSGVAGLAQAATPFNAATVTRLQNKVSYGNSTQAEAVRPAIVQDVVQAQSYLLSETDARAELKYPDGSIVRIGQNTIFSFEAESRTLTLKKGTFVFYVPKGLGNTTIKTPSLTAAITGTVGKVSENLIAIILGSVQLVPSGRVVNAGQFARMNPDGTITIDFFDPSKALDGKLMTFNGVLPPFRENALVSDPLMAQPDLSGLDLLERATNHPSAQQEFFPVSKPRKEKDDGQDSRPPSPTPKPSSNGSTSTPPPKNPNPTDTPNPTGTGTPRPTATSTPGPTATGTPNP